MATERFEIRDPSTNALVLDFEHETFSKDRAVNQELALDWAENNNLITRQELQALGFRLSPTSSGPEEEASTLENIGDWTMRNASDVLGVVGGVGAGLITANPWIGLGTAALLTGVGEGVEDVYEGKDIDYMGAAKEAGVSGVTDLASMGAFRYAKPVYHALGFGAKQADTLIANQAAKNALPAGSKESLQQTQNLLLRNSSGGRFSYTQGLTAYQTGEVGALKAFAENLTELGIFSGTTATQRAINNSRIIQEQVQELMADSIGHFGRAGTFDVGANIHGIIAAGRKALNLQYGQGLEIIEKQLGPTQVNIAPLRNALSKFKGDNNIMGRTFAGNNEPVVGVLSTLDDGTIRILDGELGKLQNVKTVRAQDLISIQKSLRGKIQEAGNFGSQTYNTVVERQLTQLSDALNKPIADLMEAVSPGASKQYNALNRTYAAARGTLLPTINDAVIRAGDKESYDALGRILIGSQANKSQVRAMLKSVRQAFASVQEAGLPIEGAIQNVDQAMGLIRQGYLSRLLPSIHADTFHIKDYVKLAKNLEDPTTAALAKELLGEQWGSFKSFANAMAEASNHPDSILGGLVLRGREAGAITGLASGMAQIGGAGIAGVGSLGSAAGIILTPYVLAKIITNKKAINMLLTANAESMAKGVMKQTDPYAFIVSRMSQIIAELPEDDKLDIRNHIRQQESGVTIPPPSEPQVPHQLDQWGQQRKPMAMGQGPL